MPFLKEILHKARRCIEASLPKKYSRSFKSTVVSFLLIIIIMLRDPKILKEGQGLVFLFTLIVLVYYTSYTHGLLKEQVKMNEAKLMPFLFFNAFTVLQAIKDRGKEAHNITGRIEIHNLGEGVALDIKMEDINTGPWIVKSKKVSVLLPYKSGLEMREDVNVQRGDKRKEVRLPGSFAISCKDLADNKYKFIYTVNKETGKILFHNMEKT